MSPSRPALEHHGRGVERAEDRRGPQYLPCLALKVLICPSQETTMAYCD